MRDYLRHRLLSPFVKQWLAHSAMSWRRILRPSDGPLAHASGENADRLALVGAGIAVGYGMSSIDLALGGQLARQVSGRTGRGITVETFSSPGMKVSECLAMLKTFDFGRFDAVVLTIGTDEALRLVPPRRFRRQLRELFSWVELFAPSSISVSVVAIPAVPSIMKVPAIAEAGITRHCARLNHELRAACGEHERVTFIPFIPLGSDLLAADRRTYAGWARLIAPTVARMLDAQLADPREPAAVDEGARQRALTELDILDSPPDKRFDRIVRTARDLFGVSAASITLIDRHRQWTMASVGMDPADSPRAGALGDATVHNGKIFVVEDAREDPRFAGHLWTAGKSGIRFFAGFPIEAVNGQRIGALCLMDSSPRSFSSADGSLLGELAMQIEAILWGGVPAGAAQAS